MNKTSERYVSAENVTGAWIKALEILMDHPRHEAFNLTVRISSPTAEHLKEREIIENCLIESSGKLKKGHIEMVAQTIFPRSRLYFTCPDPSDPGQRKQLYDQYLQEKAYIRAFNNRGTYFQRLIWWPDWDSVKGINQLENVIRKMNTGQSARVVYEINLDDPPSNAVSGMHLYNPKLDRKFSKIMGFPCLSYISIKPESVGKSTGKVHMTALYRNHYFISRAYGNYLGLGWLLQFIADATGKEVGELLCVSSLAQVDFDKVSKSKIQEMLRTLRQMRSSDVGNRDRDRSS
jgi:hypothetical protein